MLPVLYLVTPCYNEESVLPITAPLFIKKIEELISVGAVDDKSHVLFVDDGSTDCTYELICGFARESSHACGISLSRNCGHENAVLAGMTEAGMKADIIITTDCDGQDDIGAVNRMVDAYKAGNEIVYGVRSDRHSDSFFKRTTAQGYYRFLRWMGVGTVYNHADYRLMSRRAVEALRQFREVNLFLRGIVPLIGYQSTVVYYERAPRKAGESHYSLRKMLDLAWDGITGLSSKPMHLIRLFGLLVVMVCVLLLVVGNVTTLFSPHRATVNAVCVICAVLGVNTFSLGMVGEYVAKNHMETKARPRYFVEKRTEDEQ